MGVKILFFSRGTLGQNSMFPEKGGQNSIFFPSALKKGGQNRGAYQPTSLKGVGGGGGGGDHPPHQVQIMIAMNVEVAVAVHSLAHMTLGCWYTIPYWEIHQSTNQNSGEPNAYCGSPTVQWKNPCGEPLFGESNAKKSGPVKFWRTGKIGFSPVNVQNHPPHQVQIMIAMNVEVAVAVHSLAHMTLGCWYTIPYWEIHQSTNQNSGEPNAYCGSPTVQWKNPCGEPLFGESNAKKSGPVKFWRTGKIGFSPVNVQN